MGGLPPPGVILMGRRGKDAQNGGSSTLAARSPTPRLFPDPHFPGEEEAAVGPKGPVQAGDCRGGPRPVAWAKLGLPLQSDPAEWRSVATPHPRPSCGAPVLPSTFLAISAPLHVAAAVLPSPSSRSADRRPPRLPVSASV